MPHQTPNPSPADQTMTSEPEAKKPLPVSSSYGFEGQLYPSGWHKRVIRQLKIGEKISLGYALALVIGVVGTTSGFLMGNNYHQRLEAGKERALEEIRLLYRLKTGILETRLQQQQLIPLGQKPERWQKEYSSFMDWAAEVEEIWPQVKSFIQNSNFTGEIDSRALFSFLQTYEGVADAYFKQVEQLRQQSNPSFLKLENVGAARKQIVNFANSPVTLKFEGISDKLTDLIQHAESEEIQAEAELKDAARLRVQLIAASILLSGAIALLLAIYTSRAITRPIQAVIAVAQQVTEESNFDLYVPKNSEDEMGVLADSLNQLIFRVRNLLDNLQAEKEAQLLQSEKMANVGRIVASVAEEIKNPINFIYGNLDPAQEYFDSMITLISTYSAENPKPPPNVRCLVEEIELDFLKEDLPKLLQSMRVGAKRARAILSIMQNFSRLDEAKLESVDLHKGLNSTLVILRNRYKKRIKVVRSYGDIPAIQGYTGLLYQVFINMLTNAIEALDEKTANPDFKQIAIATRRLDSDWVEVRISDNGPGIAPENQPKIFNTFFTTKQKGVGGGLGLAICRQIVVTKHGGKIICESEVGKGTVFAIALPIRQEGSSGTFIQTLFS